MWKVSETGDDSIYASSMTLTISKPCRVMYSVSSMGCYIVYILFIPAFVHVYIYLCRWMYVFVFSQCRCRTYRGVHCNWLPIGPGSGRGSRWCTQLDKQHEEGQSEHDTDCGKSRGPYQLLSYLRLPSLRCVAVLSFEINARSFFFCAGLSS